MDLSETDFQRVNNQYQQSLLMSKATPFLSAITTLAADLFKVPITTILFKDVVIDYLLPDEFKTCLTDEVTVSFYDFSLQHNDIFIINDAKRDAKFKNNYQVKNEPFINFYCGYPIRDSKGKILAILSIIDTKARDFKAEEFNKLKSLESLIQNEIKHIKNERLNQLVNRDVKEISPLEQQILSKEKIEKTLCKLAQLFYSLNKPFGIVVAKIIPTASSTDNFDAIIIESGQLISKSLRKIDSVGKWDGNHFIAIINCKDGGELNMVGDRIIDAQKVLAIDFKIGMILTNSRQSQAIFTAINKLLINIDSNNNRIICL